MTIKIEFFIGIKMSLFGNRNTTVYLGAFLDRVSIARLSAVSRTARNVSAPIEAKHLTSIKLKTDNEKKLAYNCVLCYRKTPHVPGTCTNTDSKYSVCEACRAGYVAKCISCSAERLTYFMATNEFSDHECGNGICDDAESYPMLASDGFCAGINYVDKKWTDFDDLPEVRQVIDGRMVYEQNCHANRFSYMEDDPSLCSCDDCGQYRSTTDLVSYPISILRDKFGVFCRDKSCMPEYSVPKSWQVPFVYDKSWR